MRLAWKELTYNWKKYLLVEVIVILMMFMVLFLSGLVSGLGRAVSSGIEIMDASAFVLVKDSEKLITVSSLTDAQYKKLQDEYGSQQTPLDIQRAYLQKASSDKKIDVTYFGIDPTGFLAPKTYAGKGALREQGRGHSRRRLPGEGHQPGRHRQGLVLGREAQGRRVHEG